MAARDELEQLLDRQLGLATRAQLQGLGVTPAALRWRLNRQWRAVLGRVVLTRAEPLTPQQRLVAAALESGPRALITAEHACLAFGLGAPVGSRPIRVLVPMSQDSRDVGFVQVRRTRRLDAGPWLHPSVRSVPLARAVLDAARAARRPDEARSLVIEAVQSGRATVDELQHELEAGPRRGRALARAALAEARAGAWSVPEADLLRLCGTSTVLSHAWPNPVLRSGPTVLVSPDAWFDDVALAVMVHSKAHHLREAEWQTTVERDGELTAHGVVVLGLTPASIGRAPGTVLARIEAAYRVAAGGPRPAVRMEPRGWGL